MGATIAQQPLQAPLLAETAAVLGLRTILVRNAVLIPMDSGLEWVTVSRCYGTSAGYAAVPDGAGQGE